MSKTKRKKPRDWDAVDAHFRNSAGAMNSKPRKERRSFKQHWREELEEILEEEEEDENWWEDLV